MEAPDCLGQLMLAEIHEQPAALRRLIAQTDLLDELAGQLAGLRPRTIRLLAHGSSDNAASYGVYAFSHFVQVPAFRDSISLPVYALERLPVEDALFVAISQSGRTPDLVAEMELLAERGAWTLGITNDPTSPLAAACRFVLPLAAGEEQAVAATKTYCSTLAAVALAAGLLGGRQDEVSAGVAALADSLEGLLPDLEERAEAMAPAYADCQRLFTAGRGPEYSTARETALKLTETCRIVAAAWTTTDFAHGPLAAVDEGFPLWLLADRDATLPAALEAAERAVGAGADLIVAGNAALQIPQSSHRFALPEPQLPLLAPVLAVVPSQLFAHRLALVKGLDPDAPVHLRKVTEAL